MIAPAYSQVFSEAPEIAKIEISGNKSLTTKELRAQVHLKEKRRFFSKGSLYNSHFLDREMKKLENYYTLHGFLDVQVSDSLFLDTDNLVHIYLKISEGKRYYLRKVTLSGNNVFSDEEYFDLIEFRAGSSFNTFKIRENLTEMLSLYRDDGYPLINIQDSIVVDDSVSLFVQVKEGPKLSIGSINIEAPNQIPDYIIRREIIIRNGDPFNLTNIEESKRRLYETNLFNSVNIRLGKVDLERQIIDLDVEIIAAKFRGFDMNFGVKQGYIDAVVNQDPVLSIGLSGSWYHNNLFDSSRRIKIQTKISSIYPAIMIPQEFKFDLFYIEPWLAKYRIPLTINPFYWFVDYSRSGFKNTAFGLRGIMTYRWFRKIKIQALTEWSQSISSGTPLVSGDLYQEARKIGAKLIWDERDNYFYPHQGFKLVIEPGLVGYFLGGQNNYLQIQASLSSYWNIISNVVFAHNLNIGLGIVKDAAVEIPYEKRFFLGGSSSIRGYRQQSLGPQTLEGDKVIPTGGNIRYFSNFELRFPIYNIVGGEVFLDIGNLWSDMETTNFKKIKMAIGGGITIDTPIGPARIDYGIPIGDESPTNASQTHIAIAYAF